MEPFLRTYRRAADVFVDGGLDRLLDVTRSFNDFRLFTVLAILATVGSAVGCSGDSVPVTDIIEFDIVD